jgi:3-deoxy-D-manno-octulosonic-acid transferase
LDWLRHSGALVSAAVGLPLAATALLLRPGWGRGVTQRLGRVPRSEVPGLWVHAASVGEVRAGAGLVEELLARGFPVYGSSSTATGRDEIRRSWPGTPASLVPIDHPWCVAAALRRVAPRALVLVETELWPCLIAAASRSGIPVVVVSGRVSDRSFPRYRWLRRALGPTFARIDAIGARSAEDARRFGVLGVDAAKVFVTGDLKLDPQRDPPQPAPDLARALAETPYFVAASTHAGEERAVMGAFKRLDRGGAAMPALVMAPRHTGRVAGVARQLRSEGLRVHRRSQGIPARVAPGEVLLLDTLGELPALFAAARVAFVGGTLVPVGGHNVLEPVQAGCPVIFGPHVQNVRRAVELLEESGAGLRVLDAEALAVAVEEAMRDPEAARRRAARGRAQLEEHRGSVERSLALLEKTLASGRGE